MSIFELIFFGLVAAAIFFASKWLGAVLGISGWFVAAPLAIGAFFVLRQLGRRLAGRRADPWPVQRDRKLED
jgi:hypothetical protein